MNEVELEGQVIVVEKFKPKAKRGTTGWRTNLFIKNFPKSWQIEKVTEFIKEKFHSHGKITSECIKFNERFENHFAFVAFEKGEDAASALKEMENFEAEDTTLYVGFAQKKHARKRALGEKFARSVNDTNLFVKSINYDVTEEQIKTIFSKFGNITSIGLKESTKVPKIFEEKGIKLKFAFINFEDSESAKKALTEGKKDPEVIELISNDHDMRKEFLHFAQPKQLRQQYLKMQKKNMMSTMLLQQQMVMMSMLMNNMGNQNRKMGNMMKKRGGHHHHNNKMRHHGNNNRNNMMMNPMMMMANMNNMNNMNYMNNMGNMGMNNMRNMGMPQMPQMPPNMGNMPTPNMPNMGIPQMPPNMGNMPTPNINMGLPNMGGMNMGQLGTMSPLQAGNMNFNQMSPLTHNNSNSPMTPMQSMNQTTGGGVTSMGRQTSGTSSETKDINWLISNSREFEQLLMDDKRKILGNLMYFRVASLENIAKEYVPKITGMLIDLDVLDLSDIIDILQQDDVLLERVNDAVEIINEADN